MPYATSPPQDQLSNLGPPKKQAIADRCSNQIFTAIAHADVSPDRDPPAQPQLLVKKLVPQIVQDSQIVATQKQLLSTSLFQTTCPPNKNKFSRRKFTYEHSLCLPNT